MAALKPGGKFAILDKSAHLPEVLVSGTLLYSTQYTVHNIHYTAHTIYSTINNIQHNSRPHVHNTQYTKSSHFAELLASGWHNIIHNIQHTMYSIDNFADSGRVADFSQIAPTDKHDAP